MTRYFQLSAFLIGGLWAATASCFTPCRPTASKSNWTLLRRMSQINDDDRVEIIKKEDASISRRFLLHGAMAAIPSMAAATMINPLVADAAIPVTVEEAENFGARAQRLFRPKPPKALRPKLNKDFAVLLMRSSYNALDQIDAVAMDQFQRDFFIIRQAEYEPYVTDLGPGVVKQGDLSDPYYFDFISFAQYATINREISKDPPLVFNERKPVDVGENEPQQFTSVVIRRDPSLSNDKLAPTHTKLVASSVLDKLEETFGDSDARLPKVAPNSRPNAATVLTSVQQLVKLFLINGYAWDGNAAITKEGPNTKPGGGDATGTQFSITLTTPATIWSSQALELRNKAGFGGGLMNTFLLSVAKELVARMGYEIASSSTSIEGTRETSTFTIR